MIFINHIKNAKAAKDYYAQHISRGDGRYYTEENAQQMTPIWWGRGTERLGLKGEVKQEDFFALCDNRNPHTGEQMTPRMDDDRRVVTDFTFDAPKTVSMTAQIGGADGKGDKRVLPLFVESVLETADEMEADAKTRVRKGGANYDKVTGNMVGALGIHWTGREVDGKPDMQLHGHLTIENMTWCGAVEGWKAIQLGDIVRDKLYYQAAFHARFASKLKDLGYGIERDGTSFKIAGIDRETVEKFSRRSAVIEAEAQRLGIEDEAEKSQLGRRTREKKGKDRVAMPELRAQWDKRLTDDERLALRTASAGLKKGDALITPEQAKEYALEHAFQNASAVSEKRLMAEALMYSVGSVKPDDVADITQHAEAIPVPHEGQLFVTTKTVLANEVAMLQFAKDGQRKQKSFLQERGVPKDKFADYLPKHPSDSIVPAREQSSEKSSKTSEYSRTGTSEEFLAGLSVEQTKAAFHILNSRDTVTGVVGKAGTGKTRMMHATKEALESASGKKVFVFAPSSQASRGVLKKEGFRDAETLEMLLRNEILQEQARGQVLWVDEAGLISSKDMRRLMEVAKKHGNRVILSGDYTQHSSVEAGDAFRLLEKEAGVRLARLTEIRRQTEPGYKKAVEAISQGTGKAAQKGFDALNKMGWVVESSGEKRHAQLVFDYLQAQADGKSALIIAPTHAEGQRLTEELRAALKERGAIGKERTFTARRSTGWTDAQKGDTRNYEPGMIVEFHQNAKGFTRGEKAVVVQAEEGFLLQKQDGTRALLPLEQAQRFDVFRTREITLGRGDRIRITKNGEAKVAGQAKGTKVNNGDIFQVEGFTKEGDIRLEKGKLLPKDWGHLSLGYVDTSYSSQGKTVDRVFVAVGKASLAAANAKQWYVSLSRGREMAKVYVEDKQEVREAINRTGERLSAVELTGTKLRNNDSWRSRFSQTLERNRVGRFLKQRADALAGYWKGRQKDLSYA